MSSLLLVGPALSVEVGLVPALVLVGIAVGIADRRGALVRAVFADPSAFGGLGAGVRRWSALATISIAAVLVAVAARAVAAVTIAFPATLSIVALALVVAAVAAAIPARGRLLVALAGALAIPVLVDAAERYEAAGIDARGRATSGPILGIHPFQVVSVVVDGHGPHDIPFNDYVEPDGSRGYGPEAFAEALERALHRIAELQFADGPARPRQAFGEATVEVIELPPTRERLDAPVGDAPEPHFVVTSGTHGQRSRVEFVCPGIAEDPRGRPADDVMERMCPARHAGEGSAGLGVTGRWTGYTEARGNERVGLGRLLGWTRSDDAIGRKSLATEATLTALGMIALGLLLGAGRRRAVDAARAVEAWSATALTAAAALGALALLWDLHTPVVGPLERPPVALDLAAWLPLAALFAGLGELASPAEALRWGRARRLAAAALVVVATFAVAGAPSMSAWISPTLKASAGPDAAFQAWIVAAGDRLQGLTGIDLAIAEACVAGVVVAGAIGLCVGVSRSLGAAALGLLPGGGRSRRLLVHGAIAGLAAALCVSRQSEGGALFLGPSLLLSATVVAGWLTAAAEGRRRVLAGILLLGSAAATILALAAAGASEGSSGPLRGLYLGLAVVVTAGLAVVALRPRPRSGP